MSRTKLPCPHCGGRPNDLSDHLRDTGDVTVRRPESCPVLFAKRNSNRDIDLNIKFDILASRSLTDLHPSIQTVDDLHHALYDGWVS